MTIMNLEIDDYLARGCGRCDKWNTPDCKVNTWRDALVELRRIALDSGLTEDRKWGVACYTVDDKNVFLVTAFRDYAALSFFKGVLLKNSDGLLVAPGENSQSVRLMKFTSVDQVLEMEDLIRETISEAVENEQAGLKVEFKATSASELPEEFQAKLDELPELKVAFESLTPGRQRGYLLHFTSAKQSATRAARVEKCIPKIMEGKGFHDR